MKVHFSHYLYHVSTHFTHIRILLQRLGIVLLMFTIGRVLFYLMNMSYFEGAGFVPFLGGIRFDLAAIFMMNVPLILLWVLPLNVHHLKWHKVISKILFHVVNGACFLLNTADIAYYRFAFKRSTMDLFRVMGGGEEDLGNVIPQMVGEFWYLLAITAAMIALAEFLYRRTHSEVPYIKNAMGYLKRVGVMTGFIAVSVIIARGGFQLRPITIINASAYASANHIPLVLNTPFTLIKTYGKVSLPLVDHYHEDELVSIFDPIHEGSSEPFQAKNVAIIVLESFSSEYMNCISGEKTYTPFLDSLAQHSVVFTNAFANSKKSIEAIPAILSGIPSLMNDPLITSPYSGNEYVSMAGLLKPYGYSSSFYHGATNGSMSLDQYAKLTGFDAYYGMTEYDNMDDHDGVWGIFDEEFLAYWAKGLAVQREPFLSVFFTISSHHPYTVPERYAGQFPEGPFPNLPAVGYTDFALSTFFEQVKSEPWYENTIFVIVADHTNGANSVEYRTSLGTFSIPLLIFEPGGPPASDGSIAQQVDVLPTVLGKLNFPDRYLSFGNDLMRSDRHYVMTYLNDVYQVISNDRVLQFDGTNPIALYAYKEDPLLREDLLEAESDRVSEMTEFAMAYIQQFNNRMIENRLIGE